MCEKCNEIKTTEEDIKVKNKQTVPENSDRNTEEIVIPKKKRNTKKSKKDNNVICKDISLNIDIDYSKVLDELNSFKKSKSSNMYAEIASSISTEEVLKVLTTILTSDKYAEINKEYNNLMCQMVTGVNLKMTRLINENKHIVDNLLSIMIDSGDSDDTVPKHIDEFYRMYNRQLEITDDPIFIIGEASRLICHIVNEYDIVNYYTIVRELCRHGASYVADALDLVLGIVDKNKTVIDKDICNFGENRRNNLLSMLFQ